MDLGLERIEAPVPDARPVKAREEGLQRREGLEGERVLALAAAHRVAHEARFAEHPEVPADGRAAHGKHVGDSAGRARRIAKRLEDLAPDRISERLGDGIHVAMGNTFVTC